MRRPSITNNQRKEGEWRPTCYSCFRPSSHCICQLIAPFEAHCKILILQHPHERRKYYSTAKLVLKALTNSSLLRGIEFEPAILDAAISGSDTYLLFPAKDAIDCEQLTLGKESKVVVLDGTWSEAGKILNRNPRLMQLPKISFNKPLRSNYRIRKQPKDNYLSTIESIGHLLKLNAASGVHAPMSQFYDRLFVGFEKMVDQQLHYFPRFRASAEAQVVADIQS